MIDHWPAPEGAYTLAALHRDFFAANVVQSQTQQSRIDALARGFQRVFWTGAAVGLGCGIVVGAIIVALGSSDK